MAATGALALGAQLAHIQRFRPFEASAVVLTIVVYTFLRYPKRLIFRIPATLLGVVYIVAPVIAWREATHASILWSIAGDAR